MQAVLESPLDVHQTELATPTPQALADLYASSPAPASAPQAPLKKVTPLEWVEAMGEMPIFSAGGVTAAAAGWCAMRGAIPVPGTGEPDVEVRFHTDGPVTFGEIGDFLDYAAERIIRFGWVQGMEQMDGHVCSMGALRMRQSEIAPRMATGRAVELAQKACSALTNYLHRHHSNNQDIVGWNDTQGRTVDEVVAAFRGAAAEMRSERPFTPSRAVLA